LIFSLVLNENRIQGKASLFIEHISYTMAIQSVLQKIIKIITKYKQVKLKQLYGN